MISHGKTEALAEKIEVDDFANHIFPATTSLKFK